MKNILMLYKSVKPVLEYTHQAWHSWFVKDIQKIEAVQRWATVFISIHTIRDCNFLSLEDRINQDVLIDTFKILNGFRDIYYRKFFELRSLRGQGKTLIKHHKKKGTHFHYFSQKVNNSWNELTD